MPRPDGPDRSPENALDVHSFQSSPDRTIFAESGNSDAWIATDLTVQPDP